MKLTLPTIGDSVCRIMVDGRQVGMVFGRYWDWEAKLWPVADEHPGLHPKEQISAPKLRHLRAELRRRLDEDGPWWTVPDTEEAST